MDEQYDYIIVGGGSSGGIIATRLTEDPNCSVLLLEAGRDWGVGGDIPEVLRSNPENVVMDETYLWKYDVSLREGRPTNIFMGKVLGGSGAINGSFFMRGTPSDYDSWGSALWSYETVLPYFKKVETDRNFQNEYHGASGLIPVRRYQQSEWLPFHEAFYSACREGGFEDKPDLNDPRGAGVGPTPMNNVDGMRRSTAIAYIPTGRKRPNLTIQCGTLVTKVLFEGTRAVGVEAVRDSRTTRLSAGEVILAGGSQASAQILMLSGVGPEDELRRVGIDIRAALPAVGRNVTDHASIPLRMQGDAPPAPIYAGARQVVLVYTSTDARQPNDMYIASMIEPRTGELALRCTIASPASAGSLHLVSAEPTTRLFQDYRYLAPEFDRKRLREGARLCLDLARSSDMRALSRGMLTPEVSAADDASVDDWLYANVQTGMHGSGACRMGTDPVASVVDHQLRVHGFEHLRVADISVSPAVVSAPTNATAMMIGERAADLIRASAP